MPGFDRTGPNGEGAMTGRRNGLCTGNNVPGMGRGAGFGRGMGRGRGLGRRRGGFGMRDDFDTAPNSRSEDQLQQEISEMREQISRLQEELSKFKNDK